jgi:hypothetical protein
MVIDLDELVERVAVRVAELLADRLPATPAQSPWLNVDEAAAYLRCAPKRIHELASERRRRPDEPRLPVHRDGKRLIFRRDELDEYVLDGDRTAGKGDRPADHESARRLQTRAVTSDSARVSARRHRAGKP